MLLVCPCISSKNKLLHFGIVLGQQVLSVADCSYSLLSKQCVSSLYQRVCFCIIWQVFFFSPWCVLKCRFHQLDFTNISLLTTVSFLECCRIFRMYACRLRCELIMSCCPTKKLSPLPTRHISLHIQLHATALMTWIRQSTPVS